MRIEYKRKVMGVLKNDCLKQHQTIASQNRPYNNIM